MPSSAVYRQEEKKEEEEEEGQEVGQAVLLGADQAGGGEQGHLDGPQHLARVQRHGLQVIERQELGTFGIFEFFQ